MEEAEDIEGKSQVRDASTHIMSKYTTPLLKSVSAKMSVTHDKWSKRVIAPYVNMVRKGQKISLKRKRDKYSFFLSKKSSVLMKNLTAFLANNNDLPGLLYESADVLKSLTNSLGARLYLIDDSTNQLYQYQKNVMYPRCRVNYDVETGNSVPAWVARHTEYVMVDDVTIDTRFPDHVHYKDNVKPVLCVPIVTNNACFGVLEFYRDLAEPPYGKAELKTVVLVSGWIGLAIQQNIDGVILHKKQDLNDYLLQLVLAYYSQTLNLEQALGEIVNYAKSHLLAEKGAFYVLSRDQNNDELLANVYEEGITDSNNSLIKKKLRVKLDKEKSVVSMVARTGEMLNIKDVYNDERFNSEITKDNDLMVINRTELCMPITTHEKMLGVISIVNKQDGKYFTEYDEGLLRIIVTYSCMILYYSSALAQTELSGLKLEQTTRLLHHNLRPCKHDVDTLRDELEVPKNIRDFSWYIIPEEIHMMPRLYVYMMLEIIPEEYINMEDLYSFTLTVMASYRQNPYHNFEHAFNVSHCMYTILQRNRDKFSLFELQAFMISTLCHDIDHLGFTNNFLLVTNHLYCQLYDDSPWEHHHVFVTRHVLAVYNVFNNITDKAAFMELVKSNILHTDLVNYFRARSKINSLISEDTFNLNNTEHKKLASAIMMTACDLSGQCKPFSISKRLTDALYMEFYNQGDVEKTIGIIPLATMDRNNQHLLPDDQVQFISIVVMGCVNLLRNLLPNTEDIYNNCELLRDTWKSIIDSRGEKLWRQCDSLLL